MKYKIGMIGQFVNQHTFQLKGFRPNYFYLIKIIKINTAQRQPYLVKFIKRNHELIGHTGNPDEDGDCWWINEDEFKPFTLSNCPKKYLEDYKMALI